MDFTPRQLDAIDIAKAGQDTCVVAGPGSGKTRVLVERYRRLVHYSPRRIRNGSGDNARICGLRKQELNAQGQ